MNKKKVLVTGGSGYYGSLLIDKLINKGYVVSSLDINEPDYIEKLFKFYKIDITNKKSLIEIFSGYDIIFHNAAQVPSIKNKKLFWEVNYEGTKNICEAALLNNVKKIVYTSSSAIYGIPEKNPVFENTNPKPLEDYGKAKLAGEEFCRDFCNKGISISIIRPRTILGHGRMGIFSMLFKWISQGIDIPVLNGGGNIYQFVHAEDLADASILASLKEEKYSSYNVGAVDYKTMRQTLEELCDYAGTGSRVYSLPLRPIEIGMNLFSSIGLSPLSPYHSLMYGRSLYFDISKIEKDLGFTPKHSTTDMFRQSYDWYINNIDQISKNINASIHQKPVKELFLSYSIKLLSKIIYR